VEKEVVEVLYMEILQEQDFVVVQVVIVVERQVVRDVNHSNL
jgi:hypothetical protein